MAQDKTPVHWGASAADWLHFDVVLGLTRHLLPVVSNTTLPISSRSSMESVGKIPSNVNHAGFVSGFTGWTSYQAKSSDIPLWSANPDLGISVQCREIRALDVDIPDEDEALAVRTFITAALGQVDYRMRDNSAKFLVGFRMPGDYAKRVIHTPHGIIEFLADGQQFIAAGTHPSGVRYAWRPALPEFALITPEAFEALFEGLEREFGVGDTQRASKSTRPVKLAAVLTQDPVAAYLVAQGIAVNLAKDGRIDLVCPWVDEHSDGAGNSSSTSYWPAHTGGYERGHFKCQHAHCERRTDDAFLDAIGYKAQGALDAFAGLEDDSPDPDVLPTQPGRFALTRGDLFAQEETTPWLIKGVIPRAPLGVLYGASGSGKTFLALDMGLALARGLPWRGRKCATDAGAVVYLAAEGATGVRRRLRAYAQYQDGVALERCPFWVVSDVPALTVRDDALALAKAIHTQVGRAALVIVDTLARTMLGANENSSEDMGEVLSNCDGIHRATGAMVLLVHHSGKDGAKGARGWSGLRAASDLEIEVTRYEESRVARITKLKDGEDGEQFGFALRVVELGVDEDGDAITSCVVNHNNGVAPQKHRSKAASSPMGVLLLSLVDDVAEMAGSAQEDAILRTGVAQLPEPGDGRRDTRAQRLLRALESLIADKVLVRKDRCLVRV